MARTQTQTAPPGWLRIGQAIGQAIQSRRPVTPAEFVGLRKSAGPMVRSISRESFTTLARVAASVEKPTKELRMLMAGRVVKGHSAKK